MPVDTHLQWSEIRDFTGGLWDISDLVMPANAAAVMTDCLPGPSGGLRAFTKRSSFTTSGVVNTTQEKVRGLWVNENLINRSGAGLGNDYWMLTYNTSDTKCRLYRLDKTAAGPPTTWSLIKTFAAGLDPGPVRFTNYFDTSNNLYIAWSFQAGAGTDSGVWYVDYSTGTPTKLTTTPGMVWNYQSRLIVTSGATIWFTDPGAFTNINANKAIIDQNEGNNPGIISVSTFSPGDLLVFKGGGPIYLVEGDLTNFTVRQMNASKIVANGGVAATAKGPMGIIFRCAFDGVYETPDGSVVNYLSPGLAASHWDDSPLQTYFTWSGKYLLDHGAGLVLDYSTKAWFTTSMQGGGVGCTMARTNQWFLGDNSSGTMTLWTLSANPDESTNRAESYTWKSAPLRDPSGRQIRIRAIEVYARSFNGATSSLTVTVGTGAPVTIACDTSGIGGITFYGLATGEEQQITVTAASNQAGVQAPVIEVVRVGSQAAHFLKHGPD